MTVSLIGAYEDKMVKEVRSSLPAVPDQRTPDVTALVENEGSREKKEELREADSLLLIATEL
jgi:hypothetical protein